MKLGTLFLSILLISSLSMAGCSEKTSNESNNKVVVKKAIIKPPEENNTKKTPDVNESVPAPETEKPTEITKPEKAKERFYVSKGDESLSDIAARDDVYGDPLKWILLYRYNGKAFEKTGKDGSFPDKNVPAEVKLEVVARGETGKASMTGSRDHWVVNVLSSPEKEKIAPDAVRLADNGYPAYITKANVNGQDYIRLRVGFYESKTAAEDAGQKIAEILNVSDIWMTRADETEYKEFGGYK
jgi:hypothetical protein